MLSGCAHQSPRLVDAPADVSWNDAKPLASFQTDDGGTKYEIKPWYKLVLDSSAEPFYFALATPVGQVIGNKPLVARKVAGQWMAMDVLEGGQSWAFVGAGPSRNEIWTVLDCAEEDRAWDLTLLHSTDGGRTWKWSVLEKIHYTAEFRDFSLGADGRGCITLELDDCDCPAKAGYYRYHTTDCGKTWGAPEYEPNILTKAELGPVEPTTFPAPWGT
jgi:hypothetical protein